jgi:hypothetical protein
MTPNELIGCLVYRTNRSLNGNGRFLDALRGYRYCPSVAENGALHLWHFPGTAQELSQVFQSLSKDAVYGGKLKFPAVLNFQSVVTERGFQPGVTMMRYNLAIVTPVSPDWTTQEREAQAYRLVLRPIEDEFVRQIDRFPFFQSPVGRFPYMSVYVPTVSKSLNSIMKIRYGDFIDAIELPNLSIKVMDACSSMSEKITEESKKITDEIKNLTK